jgi:hypothetical protein
MQGLKRYTPNGGLAAILIFAMGICVAAVIGACSTTGGTAVSPAQQAVNAGVTSYTALDQSILAADAAVKAGILKGNDAKNAAAGAVAAKAGLDAMLTALRSANAAAAAAPATTGAAK